MYLKDLIGTDCYIMCDNSQQRDKVLSELESNGIKCFGVLADYTHVRVSKMYDRSMAVEIPWDDDHPRYSFSDLSDFLASTHPQEKVYGC